ncbi:MAG TPA: helix-turn-helix domain-containing protein [Firmicutes bacterium]|nr:helix-turn-helix domain-containing protein [Bacillota bacterium]
MSQQHEDQKRINRFREVLEAVSRISGIGICIYDLNKVLEKQYGQVVKEYHGHKCRYCTIIRELPGVFPFCLASDVEKAVALAMEYKQPFYHTCHAGLTEIIIPVFRNKELTAVVFCGQCRLAKETNWEVIAPHLATYTTDIQELKEAFEELPVLDRTHLSSASLIIDISLKHLVEQTTTTDLFELLDAPTDTFSTAMKYIEKHYHEAIGVHDVARHVHLHPAYLTRLFKKETGHGVMHHITRIRMLKARDFLVNTTIPIQSLATNLGYTHCNYFARLFRRHYGMSPSEYRRIYTIPRKPK